MDFQSKMTLGSSRYIQFSWLVLYSALYFAYANLAMVGYFFDFHGTKEEPK